MEERMTEHQFLVVHHDSAFRAAVERATDVSSWEGKVVQASMADEALGKYRANPTDCILIAAKSLAFDGIELLERFLAEPDIKVPIFLVIDEPDEAVVSRALAAGALDCLPRSRFMMGALPRLVAMTIEKSRLENAFAGPSTPAFDEYTGLGNATLLLRDLARATASAERTKTAFCLLVMDLKRFARAGQSQKDHLTPLISTEFGARMVQNGRRSDLFYQVGDQRFAALLDNTDAGNSGAFTRRIRQCVLMPFKFDGQTAEVDISIGIASFPADGKTPEVLMRMSEQLLSRAKLCHDGIATSQTPPPKEPARKRV